MTSLIVNQTIATDEYILGQNLLDLEQANSSDLAQFGVLVTGDTAIETMADFLQQHQHKVSLIAIQFAKVVDGRGYSLAYLIRQRLHFNQQLRAVGEFTRDQLFYLTRCGFNAMTLRDGEDPQAALAAFNTFSVRYQSSQDTLQPLYRRVNR